MENTNQITEQPPAGENQQEADVADPVLTVEESDGTMELAEPAEGEGTDDRRSEELDSDPSLVAPRRLEWTGLYEEIEVTERLEPDVEHELTDELVEKYKQIEELKEEKKTLTSDYTARIRTKEQRCSMIADELRAGKRTVARQFEIHIDWTNGQEQLRYPRRGTDLGAIYTTRSIDPARRQQRLVLDEERHPDDCEGLTEEAVTDRSAIDPCTAEHPSISRLEHERWGAEPIVVEQYRDRFLLRFGRTPYHVDIGAPEDVTPQRIEDGCVALMDTIDEMRARGAFNPDPEDLIPDVEGPVERSLPYRVRVRTGGWYERGYYVEVDVGHALVRWGWSGLVMEVEGDPTDIANVEAACARLQERAKDLAGRAEEKLFEEDPEARARFDPEFAKKLKRRRGKAPSKKKEAATARTKCSGTASKKRARS